MSLDHPRETPAGRPYLAKAPAYAQPRSHEGFHEGHDTIVQAWREPGPFDYAGKHYHVRYVDLWPRPYQRPHPHIWARGLHHPVDQDKIQFGMMPIDQARVNTAAVAQEILSYFKDTPNQTAVD